MTLVSAILPDATVLDVRWELGWPRGAGHERYLEGHIPGAAFVDLETALAGPPGEGGRHPLPSADVFGDTMRAAGVSGDRAVVVYDGGTSMAAARAWWVLRYFGHPRVFVLDGGFSDWLAAGHAIERGAVAVEVGDSCRGPAGCRCSTPPVPGGSRRAPGCSWMRGRPRGSAASASRSTRSRGIFLER
jgi:thiosulfate/3-mercaptopyruvate sulfurtransferase